MIDDPPGPMRAHIRKSDNVSMCGTSLVDGTFMFHDARYALANYDPRGMPRSFNSALMLHACTVCCDKVKETAEKEKAMGFIDYSTKR